ncbi:MAG: uroporphyrinogen decarboxylase [Francisellaceae bacterium]|jgi:uroporphyrinogen decarboxylase
MSLTESRFIQALNGRPHDRTPVWVMRQAGRHLPEYRKIRSQVGSFMEFCRSPELACEATLQPIKRYDFDAAILFSDILTIPDAMDLGLQFKEGEGPVFSKTIRSMSDVNNIRLYDTEDNLGYVFEAIRLVKHELGDATPLIGFAGSPWTVATYMVEGRGSKQFTHVRKMLYQSPDILHALLERNTTETIRYLKEQIKAGVDAVMIFDTWGGVLTSETYELFSLSYMKKIISEIKSEYKDIPVIMFTKGGGFWLKQMVCSGADALGLDWSINISEAKITVDNKVTLQGNLDPAVLYGNASLIERSVENIMTSYGEGYRHIFNLGHGIFPDIDPENVSILMEAVKKYGKK